MYMLTTMKAAIIKAHDELMNKGAIGAGKKDADVYGLTEQQIQQWIDYCEELRLVTNDYIDAAADKATTKDQLTKAQSKVISKWKDVLKNGTEDEFSANFFMRPADIVFIGGLCGAKFTSTAVGKQISHQTKSEFRRNIETLIGCRLTGNGILSDEDRDLIEAYEGALKTIKSKNEALDGVEKGQEKTEGLRDALTKAKAAVRKQQAWADRFKLEGDDLEDFMRGVNKLVKDLEAEIKDAESKIKAAEKVRDEKQDDYNLLITKLNLAGCKM